MTQDIHSSETAETPEDTAVQAEAEVASETQPAEPAARKPDTSRLPPRQPPRRPPAPAGPEAKLQPSWLLSASGEQLTREEILARYRRQRGLPEEPFGNGTRPVPPPGYRDRIMNSPRPAGFMERPAPAPEAPPPRAPRTFTMGQTFAIAAAMALVAGGGAGLLSPRIAGMIAAGPGPASADASDTSASALPAAQLQVAQAPVAAAPRDTVIDKKPVSTATLQVEDVTGETNSFIPLALRAEPAGLDKDMLLKISGVPENAYLTSGHREDDQVWTLSLAEVKDVKLVVPQAKAPHIDLAVAAFEPKTGELAAPVKTMTVALKDVVVEPTSAPPPGPAAVGPVATLTLPGAGSAAGMAPIPPPQSIGVALAVPETEAARQLLGSADQLFRSGNVKAALRNYEKAWGADGSAAAAYGIARSYDPLVLATLMTSNGTADKAQAIQWYQRAASAGNPEAAKAIVRLQMKP